MIQIRRSRAAVFAALTATILGVCLLVSPASAQPSTYFSQVANSLKSNPVYVDPKASPTITAAEASQLSNQIRASRKGIYLVLVDNARIGTTPAHQLPDAIHASLGRDGVVAVSSQGGFFAKGYSVPAAVAAAAEDQARQTVQASQAAHGGKAVPFEVFRNFVTALERVQVPTANTAARGTSGASAQPAAPAKAKSGSNAGKVILIILGVLLLIGIVVGLGVYASRKKQQEQERNRLKSDITDFKNEHFGLNDDVVGNAAATDEYNAAWTKITAAEQLLKSSDTEGARQAFTEAERRIRLTKQHLSRAAQPQTVVTNGYVDEEYADEPQTVGNRRYRARRDDGREVEVDPTDYHPSRRSGYDYYHPGGVIPGYGYVPMGYFPDPFWNYLMLDAMLDSQHHHDHGGGSQQEVHSGGQERMEGAVGDDTWGDTSDEPVQEDVTGDVGGDSWSSDDADTPYTPDPEPYQAPDPEPVYEAPPPPEPVDTGGGWDGNNDYGGGDYGGGDFGGGDAGGGW